MVDSDVSAGSPSRSNHMATDELIDSLKELVDHPANDDISLPAGIEEVPEADDPDAAWEELRALHLRVDRWREQGAIPADRAREIRSKLVELSRSVAAREVEEVVRSYSLLLRDVSHDIRSPLHSIIFVAEALYSGRTGSLEEAERRQVGTIYAASTSLLNLVNDLLDYARVNSGAERGIEETSFSVESVLSEVRHLVAPLVEHYDTEYRIRAPGEARFRGDPQLLCRVLTNLASNAIEAAGERGTVEVEVAQQEGGLAVEVFDDGEEADIAQIECLVSRPEGESLTDWVGEKRQGRSHGLGLLICGRLVRAAGGRADVEQLLSGTEESEQGDRDGTRIRVWLPFRREDDGS